MAKFYTFLFITIGMMLLFNILGLNTSSGAVLRDFGLLPSKVESGDVGIQNIESTPVYMKIIYIMGVFSLAVGITLGVLGRDISAFTFTGSVTIASMVLLSFVGDIISVSNSTDGWSKTLIYLITAPWIAMYIIAAWEWVRGTD
jgi:hypothetical protein